MNWLYFSLGFVGFMIAYRIFFVHRKEQKSLLEKQYLEVLNSEKYKVK